MDQDTLTGFVYLALIGVSVIGGAIAYLVPYFIARKRRVQTRGWLLFVLLFFGLTGVGWLGCLIWALLGDVEVSRPLYFRETPAE